MKTILKTSIKDNTNIEVAQTVEEVHRLLEKKGSYIFLARIKHDRTQSPLSLRKTTIKMIKEQ